MEFNTYDLYLNQVKEDDVFNSNEYKYLKENNIDTAEIEGIDKDPDAGEIKFDKDQKISDEDNKLLLKDVTDFMLDIPRDTLISILRGGTNGFQFVNNFAGAIGLTEELFGPDATDQLNQKFDKIKSDLDNAQTDSPFVTKMIAMAGQDAMYTYPIYKKLQKAGFPKMWRLPLSFALGGALAFDKKESFFVDSNSMRNLKAYIGIAEDTPIEEMYDKTVQAIEFGAFGKIFDDVLGMTKGIKKMNKDRIKQADIAVGGSAATAGVVEQFTDDDPNQVTNEMMPNPEAIKEKKNPNFNDEEIIPGTVNEYGFEKTSSLVPVFKSVLKETAKKLPNKGSGEQILNTLKNTPGLKQQELKWSGLDDFLKEKKTATKDEVKEYLENNSLDVSEVKFSKAAKKPNAELQRTIDDFEPKYIDERTNAPNYDVYETFIGKRADNRARGTMDFATVKSMIGDDVAADSFELIGEGADTFKVLRYKNLIKPDAIGIGKKGDDFYITPIELEKYKIERLRRMQNLNTGGAKFEQHTEPGGEDYTELVFKIKKGGIDVGIPIEIRNAETTTIKNNPFRSPAHMNVKSEIAHVRFKTRYMDDPPMPSNKLKVLTVEEMQSDFGIRAAKENRVFGGEKPKIADFPFKNTWYELTTKRLIRYAADNNFDAVAIPKGIVPAKRYRETLDKVKSVIVEPFESNKDYLKGDRSIEPGFTISLIDENGEQIRFKNVVGLPDDTDFIKKYPGEEGFFAQFDQDKLLSNKNTLPVLKKLISDANETGVMQQKTFDKSEFVGTGIGKGELYDKAIPSFLKKYGKKWNAKVYDDKVPIKEFAFDDEINQMVELDSVPGSIPVTIIQLTDEMKQSVQKDGQALFNIFGIGSGAAIGSNAILDSNRNNTISNITEN